MDCGWLDIILTSSLFLSMRCGRVMVTPEAMTAGEELSRGKSLGRLLGRQILSTFQ